MTFGQEGAKTWVFDILYTMITAFDRKIFLKKIGYISQVA